MSKDIVKYAKQHNIPIMELDGINYLTTIIKENNVKSILEIGSAIGYSAIKMASIDKDIKVTTIERDKERYDLAVINITKNNLNNQITIINDDALNNIELNNKFDLIFIDAAKSKSIDFFNLYKPYLNKQGIIITDNLNFHGLVDNIETIKNKRTKSLMKKILKYIEFLEHNTDFDTQFINIGDGISISRKK